MVWSTAQLLLRLQKALDVAKNGKIVPGSGAYTPIDQDVRLRLVYICHIDAIGFIRMAKGKRRRKRYKKKKKIKTITRIQITRDYLFSHISEQG